MENIDELRLLDMMTQVNLPEDLHHAYITLAHQRLVDLPVQIFFEGSRIEYKDNTGKVIEEQDARELLLPLL